MWWRAPDCVRKWPRKIWDVKTRPCAKLNSTCISLRTNTPINHRKVVDLMVTRACQSFHEASRLSIIYETNRDN
jgi:hypothetical protein